jgi:hypothetical protein
VIFRPSVRLPSELTMMICHTLGSPAGIAASSSRSSRRESLLLIICCFSVILPKFSPSSIPLAQDQFDTPVRRADARDENL